MASAYREAQLDDPDVVSAVMGQGGIPEGVGRPALREFGPEVAMLANVCDLLMSVIGQLQASRNVKPSNMRSIARPETGIDRMQRAIDKRRHTDLVDEVKAAQERWAAAQAALLIEGPTETG